MEYFTLHINVAILSYSFLTIGAILSIFILLFEKTLITKNKILGKLTNSFSLLPIEKFLFKIYWFGFILLSLTLLSGILFSNEIFGTTSIWNHKFIFSIMAWLTYSAMLFGRNQYGWRGKKAVVISLIAFVFLFLAYFGTKFVVEILLSNKLS